MVGIEHLFLDDNGPAPRGIRIFRVAFVMGLCGILLTVAGSGYREATALASWPGRPCRIVRSAVESVGTGFRRQRPYHPRISFEYDVLGQTRTASSYELHDPGTDDAAEAYATIRRYPVGSMSICYVDPADVNRAVLSRPSVAAADWFFAGVMAGTAAALWFYCVPQLRRTPDRRRRSRGRGKLVFAGVTGVTMSCLFGGLFVSSYAMPLAQQLGTRSWQPVDCTIVESNLLRNELSGEYHVVTYRTDIHYRYAWNGTEYHSNHFNLTEDGTVFRCLRARMIPEFPPGMRTTCFVNPNHPEQAVLVRRVSPGVMTGAVLLGFCVLMLLTAVLLLPGNEGQAEAFFRRHWRGMVCLGAMVIAAGIAGQVSPP